MPVPSGSSIAQCTNSTNSIEFRNFAFRTIFTPLPGQAGGAPVGQPVRTVLVRKTASFSRFETIGRCRGPEKLLVGVELPVKEQEYFSSAR